MDLSALIFVALAVAWAVYLIPKALKHHDDAVSSRSVDRFSHTMRVLARREPVNRRDARLVVTPARAGSTAGAQGVAAQAVAPRPEPVRSHREAAVAAAKRRLRVVISILLLNLAVVAVAVFGVVAAGYVALPVVLLVAWLVACRLMVKQERATRSRAAGPSVASQREPLTPAADPAHPQDQLTEEMAATAGVEASAGSSHLPVDPTRWDPMPVTLPTYVGKPAATRRTVRTIDLDATGVWTSGRSEADSALAREADSADRAARQAHQTHRDDDDHRAVGS